LGIDVKVQVVPVQMAYEADEVFMCTTAGGIMPITELDGSKIGDGKVGEITGKIWDAYWELHYDEEYSFEVRYPREGEGLSAKL